MQEFVGSILPQFQPLFGIVNGSMNLFATRTVSAGRVSRITGWMVRPRACLVFLGVATFFLLTAISARAESDLSPSALKQLSMEELMDLEVTSVSKRAEKLSETASAIQVVTGMDIRRSGASSIPEALRLADNLHVAQKGSHAWAISARGFNTDSANKLLVLMDGRSVYTPLFSGVFWDVQDYLLEDIDRIEVISGPGGTLWGANAVNGVINIISKSAKETQGLYLEGGGGTELRGFGGVRYGGTLASNIYLRVYGKYFDRDSAAFPNGDDANDDWNMGRVGFRLDAESESPNRLTLQGDFYQGEENISTGGTADVRGGNLLGRWTHVFSDASDLSFQFYYDYTLLDLPVPANAFAPAGRLEDELDTYDFDLQHRIRAGERHQFIWGLGYRFTRDVVENAPALAFLPATLEHHLFSGFLQDEIALVRDRLKFTLGTKLEHNDYTGWEYEPNARLAWTPTERQTIWTAISRAIRAPSRVDRDIRLPTPGAAPLVENLLIGGADFESEKVIAYELGYRTQLGSKATASIATFYNDYDDVRSTSPSPPPAFAGLPLFYQNNLEGHSYGVELSTSYQMFPWWRLRGGYTLVKTDLRVKSGQTDFNNALNETADPEHQFSVRTSMDLTKKVELDLRLRWVDSFVFNNVGTPDTVPSYFELDVRLAWYPTENLELSIVGQNLLNDQHLEYVIASPNPRTEVERGIYGKVAYRW
jgi:iron complex outermembrane receptor protein